MAQAKCIGDALGIDSGTVIASVLQRLSTTVAISGHLRLRILITLIRVRSSRPPDRKMSLVMALDNSGWITHDFSYTIHKCHTPQSLLRMVILVISTTSRTHARRWFPPFIGSMGWNAPSNTARSKYDTLVPLLYSVAAGVSIASAKSSQSLPGVKTSDTQRSGQSFLIVILCIYVSCRPRL